MPTLIGIEVYIWEEAVTEEDRIISINFPRLEVSYGPVRVSHSNIELSCL